MQKAEKRRELRLKRFWLSGGGEAGCEVACLEGGGGGGTTEEQPPPPQPQGPACSLLLVQKSEKRKEVGLKRLWSAVRSSSGNSSQGEDPPPKSACPTPTCSLPLLQVWPSQDSPRQSPRGEGDGQSFVFPVERRTSAVLEGAPPSPRSPRSPSRPGPPSIDTHLLHDSGIDSQQASPSPGGPLSVCSVPGGSSGGGQLGSPGGGGGTRRPSAALLHPDHARLLRPPSSHHTSAEDVRELSPSSSTTSSLTSVAAPPREHWQAHDRRRSSTMTARYSLFDALDLEYALLRAAARGSVGPYSLSESLHKLTFTQSLAFPALARGLAAGKRTRAAPGQSARPPDPGESGLNAFAKVITTLVLVLVSVLVFGVVYKFVKT